LFRIEEKQRHVFFGSAAIVSILRKEFAQSEQDHFCKGNAANVSSNGRWRKRELNACVRRRQPERTSFIAAMIASRSCGIMGAMRMRSLKRISSIINPTRAAHLATALLPHESLSFL